MRVPSLAALAVFILAVSLDVPSAVADYPGHEVWLGLGGAASFEKDIFNVPDDIKSGPEVTLSLGYIKNLDARHAVGVHVYGATERTPSIAMSGPSGTQYVRFDLNTYNFGARYRYTLSRGDFMHYVFVGANWADGSVQSGETGKLSYKGVTGCFGPGASVILGKRFLISAEAFGSFGIAQWEAKPFANSNGRDFNPSLAGGTVNLSFAWGWRP